ncbi:metal-nicotianamine transporter YSL3-like isoform X1 [Cynara cardunculus var. scolymus]|uniref:Oligopeptide transporter OPT superfamily n=2 Tax=Cynara cardunculus var. scolymus TaxID=59895 RepID=A0A103UZN3_CYNCS|nr:metal-nicotianamine transporter YSL3-like isoform X1 [Cynara cardunculus var. scolymus]KVH44674.1 Oligopeptide transporter OPT superfamily [Cynara cardunculus var. scolymus]
MSKAMRNTEMKETGEIERDGEEIEKKDDDHDHLQVSKRLQPWTKQITIRGVIASIILGSIYTVIAMKLNLTTGMTPNLNVSAALLGFVYMKTWTKILQKSGISTVPFTRHENTMIQTCSVASYTIAIGGGFGSYLLALNKKTYEMAGGANSPGTYKELRIGWMTGYSFLICFAGLFVLIPLRKILIVDYKLIFPSGMATAVLINGFHSQGDVMAKKQIKGFAKFFSVSFLWAIFQWFFTGKGECGFAQFPTFGLEAYKNTFYFDFSMTYVGTGMICPHIVSFSLLFGAVISWGIMWPLIEKQKGEWFPSNVPASSMESLNGYKVFISIALLLGDGLYNFIKILYFTYASIYGRLKRENLNLAIGGKNEVTEEERQQNEVFIREAIPMWVGMVGYTSFAILNAFVIPLIFLEVKWYYVIIAYIIAPSLAFCNAYGTGLTDWDMAYNYGKIGLFMMAALAGKHHGVVAGLVGCGLIKSVLYVSSTLMHDLKTGHLTLTSPRTMLISQAIGTAIGCIVSPLTLSLFLKAFDVGNPDGEYKAPFAIVFRNMAIIGVQGFSALPKHCLDLCYGFFAFAVGINIVKDLLPTKIGKWMPLPICMAVPFLVGGYFSIDMCVGSLVVLVWQKLDVKKAELMATSVASGLICGEGLWILPAAVLSLARIKPPICMKFLSS